MRILEPPPLPRPFQRPERIAIAFQHLRHHERQEQIRKEQLRQTEEMLAENIYQSSVRDETNRLAGWLIGQRKILTSQNVAAFIALLEKEDESKGEQ